MSLSPVAAVLDACVPYPAPLRDFLMWLGLGGCFRARWSAQIHDEWKRNLLKNRADLDRAQLDRTSMLMDKAMPGALVTGHEGLIDELQLPDPDDRHVLAAAMHCGASVIVTFNRRDFPVTTLAALGIEAQHPDLFIDKLMQLDAAAVVKAAHRQRAQLRNPALTAVQFLDVLRRQGLVQTVAALSDYQAIV